MRKPDRGPDYRQQIGVVELREIKRPDLVKDPYRVRLRFPKEDGRHGTFDAMNWREGRDKAAEINQKLEEGRAARSKSPKFERVWQEWRKDREEDHKRTNFPRAGTLRRDLVKGAHVLKEFGHKPIDAIRSYDVERWAKRLQHEHSFSWGKACYEQVHQVVRLALRKGYLTDNPFERDPVMLRKVAPDERRWVPTWDLVERLIECGNGQPRRGGPGGGYSRLMWSNIKTAIALGAGASLRFGEVMALTWAHIDFANRMIKVRDGVSAEGGLGNLKTPSANRDVPMTQWVYEALLDHLHVLTDAANTIGAKHRPIASRNPGEGFVIRNRDREAPISQPNWSLGFRRFLVLAGLIENVKETGEWHFHVLRRFYISARLALGDNFMQVSEQAGHRAVDVTFKYYARALPEPPPVWRYRFQPADPSAAEMIDGRATSAALLLPPPAEEEEPEPGLPDWVAEAVRLLKRGVRPLQVAADVGKERTWMTKRFKDLGLPPPTRIYLEARDRRYEQLDSAGVNPIEIATMTNTSVYSVEHWLRTHTAGVGNAGKSLRLLRKSERLAQLRATDAQQEPLERLKY